MIAASEGKEIEFCDRTTGNKWEPTHNPKWDWFTTHYRIKPKPREVWIRFRGEYPVNVRPDKPADAEGHVLFREVIEEQK